MRTLLICFLAVHCKRNVDTSLGHCMPDHAPICDCLSLPVGWVAPTSVTVSLSLLFLHLSDAIFLLSRVCVCVCVCVRPCLRMPVRVCIALRAFVCGVATHPGWNPRSEPHAAQAASRDKPHRKCTAGLEFFQPLRHPKPDPSRPWRRNTARPPEGPSGRA